MSNYFNLFQLYSSIHSISVTDVDTVPEQHQERFLELLDELEKVVGVTFEQSIKNENAKE